jgi:hypothetical protein
VALIVSRFRPVLDGRLYRGVNQALGLALVAFALLLLRDGLTLTGLR